MTVTIYQNGGLTLEKIVDVVRYFEEVTLYSGVSDVNYVVDASLEVLREFLERGLLVYGVNTGFGDDAREIIQDPKELSAHQYRLVRSHACGSGAIVPEDIVRASMLLRLQCLARGVSGVRMEVLEHYQDLLNMRFYPVVFEDGSVGASGDLLPLAHIALAAIGEGEVVNQDGKRTDAVLWFRAHHLMPLALGPKEGLALMNGTSYSTAIAALAIHDLKYLFALTVGVIGLACEALRCVRQAFNPTTHYLKGDHAGRVIARVIRKILADSSLPMDVVLLRSPTVEKSVPHELMVQDVYSIRAIPQGFGIFLDQLKISEQVIIEEANAVSDNPIIDSLDRDILQGANFMATRIADTCDKLKINVAYAAQWLHALLGNLMDDAHSKGLPRNLIVNDHGNSGLREFTLAVCDLAASMTQSASSNLLTTMRTENGTQDVVTMAPRSALIVRQNVERYRRILAYLSIAVAQALELRGLDLVGSFGKSFVRSVRSVSSFIVEDRAYYRDVETITDLIKNYAFPVPELRE